MHGKGENLDEKQQLLEQQLDAYHDFLGGATNDERRNAIHRLFITQCKMTRYMHKTGNHFKFYSYYLECVHKINIENELNTAMKYTRR